MMNDTDGMERGAGEARVAAARGPLDRYVWLLWVVWLAFFAYPIQALFNAHPSPLRAAVVLAAAAVFAVTYVWNIFKALDEARTGRGTYSPWAALVILAAIAVVLTIGDRSSWIELFIFVVVSVGPSLPPRQALTVVGVIVLLTLPFGLLIGGTPIQVVQAMFQAAVSGIAVIIVGRVIVLDRELRLARGEIARLAVSEERLRFARDLHDLLGHSLSLIAVKSELVGKLIGAAPDRAAAENADIEAVARQALQEVREAVAGYRQPTLASELESAREILTAAGIEFTFDRPPAGLPAAQEAALSWVIREGATNIIRHSRAKTCTARFESDGSRLRLVVIDDGQAPNGTGSSGSGLIGLRERVEAAGGTCEAGPAEGGGFRVAVTVPTRLAEVQPA